MLEERLKKRRGRAWFENPLFMLTFDTIFSMLVVTNLVVFVWRIIWDTQDLYLESNLYLNSTISIVLSFSIIFYIKYKQFVAFKHNEPTSKCAIKLFIIVFSFANINHWRGVWNFTLAYTNKSVTGVLFIGALSILGLGFMNRLCALLSIPFVLNKDCMQVAYQVSPISNRNDNYLKLDNYREYFGDLFTIQSWRSLWFLLDMYLYPNDTHQSAMASLAIGLVVYVLFHVLVKKINRFVVTGHLPRPKLVERSMLRSRASDSHLVTNNGRHKLSAKMPSFAYFNKDLIKRSPIINMDIRENYEKPSETHFGLSNRLFLYAIFSLGFLATVSTWRGLWLFQMLYAYPKVLYVSSTNPVLSQMLLNLVYISFAILILWCLNLTSSLLSRASCKDDYFTAKKVYVLRFNNYKAFFHEKFVFSMSELMKFIKVRLLCHQSDKDGLKIQDIVIKCSTDCAVIKIPENSV